MKTRFSSLVSVKKNIMQKSERALQSTNAKLQSALEALENSYKLLEQIELPKNGQITELFASRALLDSQRAIIKHNKEWVDFAKKDVESAKEKLKLDMLEFEKFKHLELQEITEILKKEKRKEAKDLDEIALMTFAKKTKGMVA
jgi:flagellar export protein FliJ